MTLIRGTQPTDNHTNGLLSKEQETLLHNLEKIVDSIGEAFGGNCEVVLHSLEDYGCSVIKIVNGHVTGRKIGSPMTDFGLEILREAQSNEGGKIGSHFSKLDDGRTLKSS